MTPSDVTTHKVGDGDHLFILEISPGVQLAVFVTDEMAVLEYVVNGIVLDGTEFIYENIVADDRLLAKEKQDTIKRHPSSQLIGGGRKESK